MRVGTFAPYTAEAEKDHRLSLDSDTPSGTIFSLLSMPFFTDGGPRIGADKERPKKLKKVRRALRALIQEEVGESSAVRRLSFEGGELVLEDEEFKVLSAVWDEFRATLPVGMNEDVVAVDEWLAGVAEFTAAQWKAELERRAKAEAPAAAAS